MTARFGKIVGWATRAAGSPWATLLAVLAILAWAVAGLLHGFTDTLQLWVNTGTTIVTFILVFLIQGATNRSEAAIQLKLDECLLALTNARNELVGAERLTPAEMEKLRVAVDDASACVRSES